MEYTPQELSGVLFYHSKEKDTLFRADWERTRIQTFYLVNIQLDKKSKVSYDKFKNEIWPFVWEKPKKKKNNEDEIMTLEQWQDVFSKPITDKSEAKSNDLIL